jgi:hypothetical protein
LGQESKKMTKRRLPRGVKLEYLDIAGRQGQLKKPKKELLHMWISKEKRRTHKRERREGKAAAKEQQ